MPPPKQKPVAATFFPGTRRRSSVTPAFMSATNRDGGTAPSAAMASNSSANDFGAALLREQVDRERRVPARGETSSDRADRVVEPAVLVDHEHATTRPACRRPRTDQPSARAARGT